MNSKNYSYLTVIITLFVSFLLSASVAQAQTQVTLSAQGIGEKIIGTLPVISGSGKSSSYILLESGKILYFGKYRDRPFTDEQAKILILAKKSPNSTYITKGKRHKVINTLIVQHGNQHGALTSMAYLLLDDGSVTVFTTIKEHPDGWHPKYCPWPYSREEAKILMLAEKQDTYVTITEE